MSEMEKLAKIKAAVKEVFQEVYNDSQKDKKPKNGSTSKTEEHKSLIEMMSCPDCAPPEKYRAAHHKLMGETECKGCHKYGKEGQEYCEGCGEELKAS